MGLYVYVSAYVCEYIYASCVCVCTYPEEEVEDNVVRRQLKGTGPSFILG